MFLDVEALFSPKILLIFKAINIGLLIRTEKFSSWYRVFAIKKTEYTYWNGMLQ